MWTLTLLSCLVVGSTGYLIKIPTEISQDGDTASARLGWVQIQKLILPLFENVCEDSLDPEVIRLSQNFLTEVTSANFEKPDILENFKSLRTGKGLLPKGEIFTEYNIDHVKELRTIFEVLLYARDFDTFYKAAAWARQNVNCGLYVDAIYLAILNRRETDKISLPAPYELLPNYFIRKDAVIKAARLLIGEQLSVSDDIHDEGNAYILDANYTSNIDDDDNECNLAYFREDVGLNTYYLLGKLRKAPWMNNPLDLNSNYGEYLYHCMKQLSIRYDLERYSNGLLELESINWNSVNTDAYDSQLMYSNGNNFETRPASIDATNSESISILQTIENNIATVVTHLGQSKYNKRQVLNHLMEILVTAEKSYENVARRIFCRDTPSSEQMSTLGHYMTSLRDPIFWKINKKIVELVDTALCGLPSYTRNELYFPGVEVLNVDVKKVMTSFDDYVIDVTDSLKPTTINATFQVKVTQPRLNRKSFALKLNITSLAVQKGLVKIFLGPRILPGELATKKNQFMLVDSFESNLKRGSNLITRSSEEISNLSEDFVSLRTLRKRVEDAEFGLNALPQKSIEMLTGFPSRLLLPKGTPEGLPLQLFVFVAPLTKTILDDGSNIRNSEAVSSPGYPLDRNVDDRLIFNLPNSLVKEIIITHKNENKAPSNGDYSIYRQYSTVGVRPGGRAYNPSSRPDYSSKRTFDYASKKRQNENKNDSSTNISDINDGKQKSKNITNIITDIIDRSLDTVKQDTENTLRENEIISEDNVKLRQYSAKPSGNPKEPFDYASKRIKYAKKYVDTTPEQNFSDTSTLATDIIEKKIDVIIKNTDNTSQDGERTIIELDDIIDSRPNEPIHIIRDDTQQTDKSIKVRPILRLAVPKKRAPTVFDYIVHAIDDESDDKVYEI